LPGIGSRGCDGIVAVTSAYVHGTDGQSYSGMSFRSRAPLVVCAAIAIATTSRAVRGEEPFDISPTDVASAVFIAKSQNRNQVHCGGPVAGECRPVGDAPVFAYWRMLENGGQLEPLLDREVPAYGLCEDQKVEATEAGRATIRVCLRALPDRPLRVTVQR